LWLGRGSRSADQVPEPVVLQFCDVRARVGMASTVGQAAGDILVVVREVVVVGAPWIQLVHSKLPAASVELTQQGKGNCRVSRQRNNTAGHV
jgi:hypothetical protein